MSPYRIEFDRRIKKDLKSISAQELARIKAAISDLAKNSRPPSSKKLKGKYRDYFRIRAGDYRIVYTVEDRVLLVVVVRIGHRREIYDNLK